MTWTKLLPCIPDRAASIQTSRPQLVASDMPASANTSTNLPRAKRPQPAWTMGLWGKWTSRESAPPPVTLSGAEQMKTYTGLQITLQSNTTPRVLKAGLLQISDMNPVRLAALAKDIDAVLKIYDDGNQNLQQAADEYFRSTYKKLFKKNSYTFENAGLRKLMRQLREVITTPQLAAGMPSVSGSSAPSLVAGPLPGFNLIATRAAYQLVLDVHQQHLQNAQDTSAARTLSPSAQAPNAPMARPASSSLAKANTPRNTGMENSKRFFFNYSQPSVSGISFKEWRMPALRRNSPAGDASLHAPAGQASTAINPEGPPPAEAQRRRARAAIIQAVTDMEKGNREFMKWLGAHDIEAVPNSGDSLNCFIIALLQHATGAYGREFEPRLAARAEQIRAELGIISGMLFSDEDMAALIVTAINTEYHTNMVPVEVQANVSGQPVISTPLDGMPDGDRVVIWQRGDHFEALRARDAHPAFGSRPLL